MILHYDIDRSPTIIRLELLLYIIVYTVYNVIGKIGSLEVDNQLYRIQ